MAASSGDTPVVIVTAPPRRPGPWPIAIIVIGLGAAVRLALAAWLPLFPDETYYWEWSRHLAPGYFDHPPAIAWVIRGGTVLLGDTPLGVRLFPVLAGFVAGWAVIRRASRSRSAPARRSPAHRHLASDSDPGSPAPWR